MTSRHLLLGLWLSLSSVVVCAAACYHGTDDVPRLTSATGSGGASASTTTAATGGQTTSPSATTGTGASGSSNGSSASSSSSSSGAPATPTFAVAGYGLRRLISTNGTTWTHDVSDPPLPPDAQMLDDIGTGIAFGNGLLAVVSHSGLVTTPDGVTWTKVGAPLPQAWYGLGGGRILFDGKQFVIVASGDSYTSPDGVTWTKYPGTMTSTHWAGVEAGNGHYVAVGDTNRKVSEDGQTWHDYVQGGNGYTGLAFGNGLFVAVGNDGLIQTTPDGVTWTDVSMSSLGNVSNLVFANGTFLTCSPASSYSTCLTSTDGATWTSHAATRAPNGPIGFGLGMYVAVTWESNIWTSTDGFTWTEVFSGDAGSNALASVGFGLLGQ